MQHKQTKPVFKSVSDAATKTQTIPKQNDDLI